MTIARMDTEHLRGLTHPIGGLADQLLILSQLLAADTLDRAAARTAILNAVVQALPATCWASLTFAAAGRRRPVTLAATDGIAQAADALQYGTGAGPCLQALAEATTIRVEDLAMESRWPSFVAEALDHTPVRSVISCSLADGGHAETSLNMYSAMPLRRQQPDLTTIAGVAAACSVALSAVDQRNRADNLDLALASGRRIGAAIGILMSSRRLTEQQAFEALRVASQHSNRKLRDLAEDVLLTGELPTGPLPWHEIGTAG
ncbi:MAG: ANTAR domain-containing protein [Jatrophihabitantaceae bacterium]